jgi:glycosyltransferase 2 family protein
LFAVLLSFVDFDEISSGFSGIRLQGVLMACGLSALVLLIASIRWWVYIHAARFPHGFWVSVRVRLVAQMLNVVIPSGIVGDGLQVFLVSRRPKLSGPLALATILMDRIVALVAVVSLLLVFTPMLSDDVAGIVRGTILICVLGLVTVFIGGGVLKRLDLARRYQGRLMSILQFVTVTIRAVHTYKNAYFALVLTFCLAIIGVFGNAAISWVLLSGLADVGFWQLIPTFCLVMLASFIPATFSGMGVREWIFFANLKSYGLTLEEAVALSLVLFAVMALVAIVLSLLAAGIGLHRGESMKWIKAVFRKPKATL